MKITDTKPANAGGVNSRKGEGVSGKGGKSSSSSSATRVSDRVEVSAAGGQIGVLKSYLDRVPDIRSEVVDALREEVESGRYHRDAMDIADAIISESRKYSLIG